MTQNKAVINYLPNRIYRIYRIARKGAILPVGGAMLPDGFTAMLPDGYITSEQNLLKNVSS